MARPRHPCWRRGHQHQRLLIPDRRTTTMNALLLALLLGADPAPAESWPGFRGDGTSRTAANLPLRWSPNENVAWRTPLPGYGQSCPVVWRDRVFVTAIDRDEKEKLFVVAVDMATGKAAWKKEVPGTQHGKNN